MHIRVSFLALVFLFATAVSAQINTINCQPSARKGLEGQTIDVGPFHFTWLSFWTPNKITSPESESSTGVSRDDQSASYCICREIHNDSSNNALYYSWPLAGGLLNEGLRPGTSDRICFLADDYAKPPAPGILYYGRRGFETNTHIWQCVNERQKADNSGLQAAIRSVGIMEPLPPDESHIPPIEVIVETHSTILRPQQYFLFFPLPRKKEEVDVHLFASSVVERNPQGYSIRTKVVNLNPKIAINAQLGILSSNHSPAPRGQPPVIAGVRRVRPIFFRRYLWPMHEDAPEANHYQELVFQEELATTQNAPKLKFANMRIETPRGAMAVSLILPIWVEQTSKSSKQLAQNSNEIIYHSRDR